MKTPLPVGVLVLNPDPDISAQLTTALSAQYTVYQAQTVAEAVHQLVIHRPAAIIMEWELPDGEALTFIQQVRSEPSLAATPILCVTRQSSIKAKVTAFQVGADDYVVLPIHEESFVYRIILLRRLRRLTA